MTQTARERAEAYIIQTGDYCVEHVESCVINAYEAGYLAGVEEAAKVAEEFAPAYHEDFWTDGANNPVGKMARHLCKVIPRNIRQLAGREDGRVKS